MPQRKSLPIAQLSQSMKHGSPMRQHVFDAMVLIHLVGDCLDVISDCDLDNLKMNDFEEVCDLVTKIMSA